MADYLKDQLLQRGMPLMPSHARSVPTGTVSTPTGGRTPIREQGDYFGKLLDFIGDPLSSADKGPLGAAPAVTQFITRGFVNKPLRERATQDFIGRMQAMTGGSDQGWFKGFANKYPRVAAHALPRVDNTLGEHVGGATLWHKPVQIEGADPGRGMTPVKVNTKAITMDAQPQDIRNTMAHELAHVAQGLGNKDASRTYTLIDRITGYPNNPFEVSARRVAERKINNPDLPPKPVGPALDMALEHPEEALGLNPKMMRAEGPADKRRIEDTAMEATLMLSLMQQARKAGHSLSNYELADAASKGITTLAPRSDSGALDILERAFGRDSGLSDEAAGNFGRAVDWVSRHGTQGSGPIRQVPNSPVFQTAQHLWKLAEAAKLQGVEPSQFTPDELVAVLSKGRFGTYGE